LPAIALANIAALLPYIKYADKRWLTPYSLTIAKHQFGASMFSGLSFNEFLQKKSTRLVLAALCVYLALAGAHQLFTGTEQADWLRGGGNLLLWGGFAVMNAFKAYGRDIKGINIPINIGLVLVVGSWIAKMN
jgi:hypothetical protein